MAEIGQRGSYVQTILVIDSMDEASGPSNSFRQPALGRVGSLAGRCRRASATPLIDPTRHESIPVIGQPGDVIFFGPYTAHMSKANTSDHYRRVLINGYATPGPIIASTWRRARQSLGH